MNATGRRQSKIPSDPALKLLLFAVIVIPAIVFVFGSRDGAVTFVMYREPKLVALQVLGWLFVLAYARIRPGGFETTLRNLTKDTLPALVVAFVILLSLSSLWAEVKLNSLYEMLQYGLLVLIFLAVTEWSRADSAGRLVVVKGMVAAVGVATVAGLVQSRWPLPFLAPIDPEFGVDNPSLMGYKNPMALAVVGQLYLLILLVTQPFDRPLRPTRAAMRIGLGFLLVLEVVYLVMLQSRASYAALIVTGIPLVLVLGWRFTRVGRKAAATAILALVVGSSAVGVVLLPRSQERLASIGALLGSGLEILGEDRATYAANTLVMVRDRPFGVGVGNWQTQYPVYRHQGRYVAYTDEMQVRRAHSDPTQFLGEVGWQGLALWAAVLLAGITIAVGRFRRDGDELALVLAFQIAALAIAGIFDYIMDLPYGKLQVFLLLALSAGSLPGPTTVGHTRRNNTVDIALAVIASLAVTYSLLLGARAVTSAQIHASYARLGLTSPLEDLLTAEQRSELDQLNTLGERFRRLAGHEKTFHKDFLLLAHVASVVDDRPLALQLARRSLELHPYYPNAFAFLAVELRNSEPEQAEQYWIAYDYIMNQATKGYLRPYPELPDAQPQ